MSIRRIHRLTLIGVGLMLTAAACSSSQKPSSSPTSATGSATTAPAGSALKASAQGVSTSSIKIGVIAPLTGAASSEYFDIPKAVTARFDVANAAGGVDGRHLQMMACDDASSPTGNASCAQNLESHGVFAIIDESSSAFGGAKYMHQAGIPVTGGAYDGPEWAQQPNTNMFSVGSGGLSDPHNPQYTQPAALMKRAGVTHVGAFGYAVAPASAQAAKGLAFAANYLGMKVGYLNDSLPYGTVNVTALALQMKQDGVDGMGLEMDEPTNFAIITAAKQAGVNIKVAVSATGYGQSLLDDPSAADSGQGVYFLPVAAPVELKTPATLAMQAAFSKYAGFNGVPDFQWYEGWLGADLMIKGLQAAGTNPTRQSFIANLRQVTSYDGGGLLAQPTNLSAFGHAPQSECEWYTILKGREFVVLNGGKPFCGTLIPNSDQA